MPYPALFAISVLFSLTAWGAVAWHSIWPALKARRSPENLKPILLLHSFRYLGLAFVLPGLVSPDLPASLAQPVAYGDLTAAILALIALATMRTRAGTAAAWTFNIFGTADLLFGFFEGARVSLPDAPGSLGAGYFILMAYVPLLLVTHALAFRLMMQTNAVASSRSKLTAAA